MGISHCYQTLLQRILMYMVQSCKGCVFYHEARVHNTRLVPVNIKRLRIF